MNLKIKIYDIDIGFYNFVSKEFLLHISSQFLELSPLAIRVELYGNSEFYKQYFHE